jgi:preprotein translocase subunit SecF
MLGQQLALPVELLRTTIVGPQVGAELFQQGMLAVLVASLAISAYLAVRFEWRQAIGIWCRCCTMVWWPSGCSRSLTSSSTSTSSRA